MKIKHICLSLMVMNLCVASTLFACIPPDYYQPSAVLRVIFNTQEVTTITAGNTVDLDGSQSSDPESDIVTLFWDRTGSESFVISEPWTGDKKINFTYNVPGYYYPQLKVIDSTALFSVAVTSLHVLPMSPTTLQAQACNGYVNLTWDDSAVTYAPTYAIFRSYTAGGPYDTLVEELTEKSYHDTDVLNGRYYFYIVKAVCNGAVSAESNKAAVFEYSSPPGKAITPNPANNATGISLTATLSWTGGSNAIFHKLYFGTNINNLEFKGEFTTTTYNPGSMTYNTTYYWRVDEVGFGGNTQGDVWSFTTITPAPGQAASPNPANNATGVSTLPTLSWTSGSNTTYHKVYFGTSQSNLVYKGDFTVLTYNPGYLTQSTSYYWRVDEVGPGGPTQGTVWNFTTFTPSITNGTVKLFTSSEYMDNPVAGVGTGLRDCQVHFDGIGATGSNAYPNLYIQITATGGNSGVVDEITFNVSSASDPAGISVNFMETGANTGIYRTMNPIHLTSGTSSSATLELKVVNEEILKVSTTSGPKVDKGEYSSMTGILCQYAHNHALGGCNPNAGQGVTDQAFNAFDQRIGTVANHRWISRDSSRCTNLSSSVLRNAGSTSSADLLIECSHGKAGDIGEYKYYVCDGLGLCGYNTYWALYNPTWPAMSNDPARVWYDPLYYAGPPLYELAPNDWRNDVEWVVLYSCDVLDSFYKWYEPLRGTGEHCHGILASYGTLSTGTDVNPIMKNHLTAFYDNMATKTVVNAYMEAAAAVGQWGAAAAFNNDNKNDYFNNVTPDTANNLIYCTYFSYQVRQEGTALGSWDELNDPNVADGNNVLYEIPVEPNSSAIASIQCVVPSESPQLAQMSAETEELLLPLSTMFVMEDNNDVNAPPVDSSDPNTPDQPLSITPAEAITMAADFIDQNGGGMPADANVGAIISRVVKIYSTDANDANVSEPNSHYVKRAIIEYRHKVDGIEIVGDSISVTIENDQVVDYARNWHDMIAPDSNSQQTIDANEALITAVANIPHVMLVPDTGFTITDISLCYYIATDENECSVLIPVWRFEVGKKSWVYVNAFSGEFIGI